MSNDPTLKPQTGPAAAPAVARPNISVLAPAASTPQTPLQVVNALFSQHPQLQLEFAAKIATLLAAGYQFVEEGGPSGRTLALITPQGRRLTSLNWAFGPLEAIGPHDDRVLGFAATIFDSADQHPQTLWDTFTGVTNSLVTGTNLSKLEAQGISNTSLQLGALALSGLIASRAFHELDPKQQAEILLARAQVLGEQARRQLAGPAAIEAKHGVAKEAITHLTQAIQHLQYALQLDPSNQEIQQLLVDLRVLANQKLPNTNAPRLA